MEYIGVERTYICQVVASRENLFCGGLVHHNSLSIDENSVERVCCMEFIWICIVRASDESEHDLLKIGSCEYKTFV